MTNDTCQCFRPYSRTVLGYSNLHLAGAQSAVAQFDNVILSSSGRVRVVPSEQSSLSDPLAWIKVDSKAYVDGKNWRRHSRQGSSPAACMGEMLMLFRHIVDRASKPLEPGQQNSGAWPDVDSGGCLSPATVLGHVYDLKQSAPYSVLYPTPLLAAPSTRGDHYPHLR